MPIYSTPRLLFAAGDVLDENYPNIPEFLKLEEPDIQLQSICRKAIRKHMIRVNPHLHLFARIPELGLPTPLTEYLLYDVELK